MQKLAFAAVLLSLGTLAGCGSADDATPEEAAEGEVLDNAVIGEDGTEIIDVPVETGPDDAGSGENVRLQPISFAEFDEAGVLGLGCTFLAQGNRDALFAGTDERGVVKIADTLVVMRAPAGLTIDSLFAGATFTTEALRVSVDRAAGQGDLVGTETTEWPATLNVEQDEGGSTSYSGVYSCGA